MTTTTSTSSTSTSTPLPPPAEAAMEGAAAPPGAMLLDLDEYLPPMDAEVKSVLFDCFIGWGRSMDCGGVWVGG